MLFGETLLVKLVHVIYNYIKLNASYFMPLQ